MADTFKALVLRREGEKVRHAIEQLTVGDLPEGDVLVDVEYSSLNYKDAMAVMGTGKIVREYPMVPGIDLAGTVLESKSPFYKSGDKVVLTGWSVGERYWGGYTQRARVKSNWLVPLPEGLDARHAMAIGTAGLTAMLCVMMLEEAGLKAGDIAHFCLPCTLPRVAQAARATRPVTPPRSAPAQLQRAREQAAPASVRRRSAAESRRRRAPRGSRPWP